MPSSRQAFLQGIFGLLIFLAAPVPASPQAEGDPISLGTYRVVHSQILGEDRVLQLHLPRGYDSSDAAYPVVYLAAAPSGRGTYFAVSHDVGDDRWPDEGLEKLRAGLEERALEGFHWRRELVPDWPFFLAPVKVRAALLDLFAGYPFPFWTALAVGEPVQDHGRHGHGHPVLRGMPSAGP
jgi:hypothetical protein